MPDLIAYTDGGCRGNPGPGAWAFIVIEAANGKALERCGGEAVTTNNKMEMLAAVEALRALRNPGMSMVLHSDSQYLIKAMNEWLPGWKARGWRRKEGELKNVDLLKELDRLNAMHRVTWQWVRGHNGDPGNEHVDALANDAMDRMANGQDPAWESRSLWPVKPSHP